MTACNTMEQWLPPFRIQELQGEGHQLRVTEWRYWWISGSKCFRSPLGRTFCWTVSLLHHSSFTTRWHSDQVLTRLISKERAPLAPTATLPCLKPTRSLWCVITGVLQRRQLHPPQHVRHHQTRSQVSFHVLWSAHYHTHRHTDVGRSCKRATVNLNGGTVFFFLVCLFVRLFFFLCCWLKSCNNW